MNFKNIQDLFSPDDHNLPIGLSEISFAPSLSVNAPCVIKTLGSNGYGRLSHLLDLAAQTIDSGDALIYLDAKRDPIVWASLFSLSENANRSHACYANNLDYVYPVSFNRVLDESGILYSGISSVEMSGSEAQRFLNEEIDQLASALSSRATTDNKRSHAVIILDGVIDIFNGVPNALSELLDKAQFLNATFVFSDSNTLLRAPFLEAVSAARVYFHAEEASDFCFDFPLKSKADLGEIMHDLQPGWALVGFGTPGQDSHKVYPVSMPFSKILLHKECPPANTLALPKADSKPDSKTD